MSDVIQGYDEIGIYSQQKKYRRVPNILSINMSTILKLEFIANKTSWHIIPMSLLEVYFEKLYY